jgi:hypothetical protein
MTMFIIVPANRKDDFTGQYDDSALSPVALWERDDFALPVSVLAEQDFAPIMDELVALEQEDLQVPNDFAWYHVEE